MTVDEDKWKRGQSIVSYLLQSFRGEVDGPANIFNFKLIDVDNQLFLQITINLNNVTTNFLLTF